MVEIQEDGTVLRLVDVDGVGLDKDSDDGHELNEDEDEDEAEDDEDAAGARGPGQPRTEIDLVDIVRLRSVNFRWADIVRMTGPER